MERFLRWLSIGCLVGVAGCSGMAKPTVVAVPAPPAAAPAPAFAEIVVNGAPSETAVRLASECTRRRIAVLEKTPERVVCKHLAAGGAELVNQPQAELWTFVLSDAGAQATKVEGRRSYDAVEGIGYAVVSFTDAGGDDSPIRMFMDEVLALDGLRGRLSP